MTTQPELFSHQQVGNLSIETPVVGRITQLTDHIADTRKMVAPVAGHMHAGKIDSSIRLNRTLEILRDGWKTTLEIEQHTNSRAVHSDIAALRANGIAVQSECMPGRIWRYRLA
jgi:hypothetical protein